jgi:hypothetical protein
MQNIMLNGFLKFLFMKQKIITISYDKTFNRYKKTVKNEKK